MNIAWCYLDKRMATMKALKDYPVMLDVLNDFEQTEEEAKAKLDSIKTSNFDSMPSAHDPQAGETRLVNLIHSVDTEKARHNQVLEYMNWFEPAWEKLSENDHYILSEFFWCNGDAVAMAAEKVSEKYNIERATAYRWKNQALDRLSFYLYGK